MSAEPASESTQYELGRNWLASLRLSNQHQIIRLREGWLLHPKIQSSMNSLQGSTSAIRVADVAAGNCIWSIDLLNENPSFQVTAFDISQEMFPYQAARHPNLHAETWSVFDPPPTQYEEHFDIVHIRCALAFLHKSASLRERVTRHLTSLLKPGGWIQWQEPPPPGIAPVDMTTLKHVSQKSWPLPTKLIDDIFGYWSGTYWIYDLDILLRDHGGCEETELYEAPVRKDTMHLENDLAKWIYIEITNSIPEPANDKEKKQRDEIQHAMDAEWDRMRKGEVFWSYLLAVAIGRKPRSEPETNHRRDDVEGEEI